MDVARKRDGGEAGSRAIREGGGRWKRDEPSKHEERRHMPHRRQHGGAPWTRWESHASAIDIAASDIMRQAASHRLRLVITSHGQGKAIRSRPQHDIAPLDDTRNGARRRNRPDRRDDKRGERRDEPTGKQDIATRPTRRDENITTPHRSRADKASRPKEHRRGNGMNRLSTSEQTAGQNQASRAPTLTASRPAHRVEERGDGKRGDDR